MGHQHDNHEGKDEGRRRGRGRPGRGRWPDGGRWWSGDEAWFGPVARRSRGAIRLSVLLVLADAPMHGYQIMQELAERSGGAWRPSPGAIYPTLQRLEDAGLIRGEDMSDDRRVYSLTEEGRKIADRLVAEGVAPWQAADPHHLAAGELRREVGQLIAAAMQVAKSGTGQQREKAEELLASTRRGLYKILSEEDAEA
jgi:DNA-binding PadR family transcriptional regulator